MRTLPSEESLEHQIAAIARRRHGVFTRAEAVAAGAGDSVFVRRCAEGRWERLHRGVFLLAGVPGSWRQSVVAAVLAGGAPAGASHRSAAAMFGLPGGDPSLVEITVPPARRMRAPDVIVHQSADFTPRDLVVVDAIPVTTPARTLIDLAAAVDRDIVEEALDDALRRGMVSIRHLRRSLNALARPGRPGISVIRTLLEARDDGSPVAQSVFETRLARALRHAGLPRAECQYEIRDRGRLAAVVDFAFPSHKVAIEADGYRWHSGRRRWERDLARRNVLTALGWRVIHLTWSDLSERRDAAMAAIARALIG